MTFSDIFKSSFLEKSVSFSALDTAIALVMAFAIGLFIFLIYKKTFSGVMYSATFGVSLVAMSMITALVILAVTSNVVLSLGMVGALSIVRFRAAIKDPMDIAFLFWAIAAGIVLGAGLLPLAVFGSLFIGIILLIFSHKKASGMPYLLVLNCIHAKAEASAMDYITKNTKKYLIKSKSVAKDNIELTIEVRLRDTEAKAVDDLSSIDGIANAVLVSYNGEYMS
jgi:uncharacterized membrane protein YhiD involved in acid resistance